MKGAKIRIEPVVFVVAAKLLEAMGDHRLLFGDDVSPDPAVGQLQFPLHRTVRIDVVAGMNEEVGTVVEHRAVRPQAATAFVDAPALPQRIARPGEGYVATRRGRGAEV